MKEATKLGLQNIAMGLGIWMGIKDIEISTLPRKQYDEKVKKHNLHFKGFKSNKGRMVSRIATAAGGLFTAGMAVKASIELSKAVAELKEKGE